MPRPFRALFAGLGPAIGSEGCRQPVVHKGLYEKQLGLENPNKFRTSGSKVSLHFWVLILGPSGVFWRSLGFDLLLSFGASGLLVQLLPAFIPFVVIGVGVVEHRNLNPKPPSASGRLTSSRRNGKPKPINKCSALTDWRIWAKPPRNHKVHAHYPSRPHPLMTTPPTP